MANLISAEILDYIASYEAKQVQQLLRLLKRTLVGLTVALSAHTHTHTPRQNSTSCIA